MPPSRLPRGGFGRARAGVPGAGVRCQCRCLSFEAGRAGAARKPRTWAGAALWARRGELVHAVPRSSAARALQEEVVEEEVRQDGEDITTSADIVLKQLTSSLDYAVPEMLLPQLRCFASFGVELTELTKLTKMQLKDKDVKGKVLKIPVSSLQQRLSWYKENFKVTGKDLGRALTRDPRILQCNPWTTIDKRVQYLRQRGMNREQLAKIFKKSPAFFRMDVKTSMEPRFQFLGQLGVPKNKLSVVVVKDPAIMHRSISSMQNNALFFLDIGFSSENLPSLIVKNPSLLRYNQVSMSRTVYFFQKLGITQQEVVVLVSRLPQVFSMSLENNLMGKFSYFLRTLKWNVHDLSSSPQVLSLSLRGRILKRHKFLLQRGRFDYFKDFKRRRWLLVSDAVFAESIAKCTLAEYQEYLLKSGAPNKERRK